MFLSLRHQRVGGLCCSRQQSAHVETRPAAPQTVRPPDPGRPMGPASETLYPVRPDLKLPVLLSGTCRRWDTRTPSWTSGPRGSAPCWACPVQSRTEPWRTRTCSTSSTGRSAAKTARGGVSMTTQSHRHHSIIHSSYNHPVIIQSYNHHPVIIESYNHHTIIQSSSSHHRIIQSS